jgi:hypothetical protein
LSSSAIHFRNDLIKILQRSLDTTLNSFYSGIHFNQNIKDFNLHINGEYGISGTNAEDYLIHSTLDYNLLNKYLFLIGYSQKEYLPDFIYSVFQSNHLSWFNYINKINRTNYFFKFDSPKYYTNFSIVLHSIKNYTFFNEQSRPEQFDEKIDIITVSLKNKIKLGRIGLTSGLLYQKVKEKAIIKLPEIALSAKLFYENYLFNKALFTNLGIECEYMSTFLGDAYMPPLRQFYLQNEVEVGGYPQVNLFINFKVKTARIFFKISNLNSGMNDDFYYTVPNYPMPGRVFRVGVDWMFFD